MAPCLFFDCNPTLWQGSPAGYVAAKKSGFLGAILLPPVTRSQTADFLNFFGHMQVTCNLGVVADFGLSDPAARVLR
jgi:hypothetical protein